MHSERGDARIKAVYRDALERMHTRRLNLMKMLAEYKETLNPYIYYEEPIANWKEPEISLTIPEPKSRSVSFSRTGLYRESELFNAERVVSRIESIKRRQSSLAGTNFRTLKSRQNE